MWKGGKRERSRKGRVREEGTRGRKAIRVGGSGPPALPPPPALGGRAGRCACWAPPQGACV